HSLIVYLCRDSCWQAFSAHCRDIRVHSLKTAVLQQESKITFVERAEAVGDHECGTPLHQALHSVHDGSLRSSIYCTGRFIQDQNGRIFQECTSERYSLAFAA